MGKQVYEKIFELIKAKGMTQKDFSKATGIPESTVSDWKKKRYNPGVDKIPVICKALGITTAELLDCEEKDEIGCRYYLSSDEMVVIESYRAVDDNEKKHIKTYVNYILEMYKKKGM